MPRVMVDQPEDLADTTELTDLVYLVSLTGIINFQPFDQQEATLHFTT